MFDNSGNIDNLIQVDTLDFNNNKSQLIISYLLRLFGIFIFGFLFWIATLFIKNNKEITIEILLNIKIETLPSSVSIFLIVIDVIFVLYIHEIIHALVFFITHKQKPQIGIRGFIIFAAAPNKVLNKYQLIINAFAPFTLITILGFSLIYFISVNNLSWVFIPTVVNAAAAGGDFMAVLWAAKQTNKTKFVDSGDITIAYIGK